MHYVFSSSVVSNTTNSTNSFLAGKIIQLTPGLAEVSAISILQTYIFISTSETISVNSVSASALGALCRSAGNSSGAFLLFGISS